MGFSLPSSQHTFWGSRCSLSMPLCLDNTLLYPKKDLMPLMCIWFTLRSHLLLHTVKSEVTDLVYFIKLSKKHQKKHVKSGRISLSSKKFYLLKWGDWCSPRELLKEITDERKPNQPCFNYLKTLCLAISSRALPSRLCCCVQKGCVVSLTRCCPTEVWSSFGFLWLFMQCALQKHTGNANRESKGNLEDFYGCSWCFKATLKYSFSFFPELENFLILWLCF